MFIYKNPNRRGNLNAIVSIKIPKFSDEQLDEWDNFFANRHKKH